MNRIPKPCPEIEILPIDTSAISQKYIARVGTERQFEVSESLIQLIKLIDGKRTVEEIAEAFSKQTGKDYSSSDVEHIIDTYLIPKGIITDDVELSEKKQYSFLYIKIPIFSQQSILPITRILKNLFLRNWFFAGLTFIGIFHVYYYLFSQKPTIALSSITGLDVLYVSMLVFITTLLHELGHSSACQRYGAKHGAIGMGLYLYFPVFYADVSDVWKLKRIQRAVVDFGGVYFQLLTLPIFYICYLLSKKLIFIYVIYTLDISIVLSLNPLLRFDGYWLASDLSGVPNLRRRSQEIIQYFLRKLFLRNHSSHIPHLQISPLSKYFLLLYALVSNVFFGIFIYYAVIHVPHLVILYPSLLSKFFHDIIENLGRLNIVEALNNITQIFFPTMMLVMLAMMVYRFFLRIWKAFFIKKPVKHPV